MTDSVRGGGDVISLPKGGGALKGLGDKFSPDLFTGTGKFSVPIALPPGRNDFQSSLALSYSTGAGNGSFGMGWALSVPSGSRLTSKGIPRYRDQSAPDERDIFVLSGAEDLVEVGGDPSAPALHRPRTEGLFAQITRRFGTGGVATDHWEVRTKDGLVSTYGSAALNAEAGMLDERAVVADPEYRQGPFAGQPEGKRDMRGGDRNDPQRVLGLVYSVIRTALASDSERMTDASQWGASTYTLGPGVPDSLVGRLPHANEKPRHLLGARAVVCACSLLGGLHHEYSLTHALA